MKDDFLSEKVRAEDILLGALGFGEDATIISVKQKVDGYSGVAKWSDGEEFSFDYCEGLDELQIWALGVLGGLGGEE